MDSQVEGNDITFNYNYAFDSFPLYMSQDLLTQYNLTSPMRITVSNGKVIKYKRILLERLQFEDQMTALNSSYSDILDIFLANKKFKKGDLEDMYLGYVYDENNASMMMWIIKAKEDFFTLSVD